MNTIENKKLAWCVEAGTADYIIGCLRFAQRMRYLESKYPVIILVANNIPQERYQILIDSNFEVRTFNNPDFLEISHGTSSSFEALKLLDYDFICNLEGDMLPLENIDYFIEDGFRRFYKTPYNIFTAEGITGYMFFKPSLQAYLDLYIDYKCFCPCEIVEEMLIPYYHEGCSFRCSKYLAPVGDFQYVFTFPEQSQLAHFPGIFKLWNSTLNDRFSDSFIPLNESEFNTFVEANKFRFILLSHIAYIWRAYNGNNKDELYCDQLMRTTLNMIDAVIKQQQKDDPE